MKLLAEAEVKPRGPYSLKMTCMVYALSFEFDGKRAYIPLLLSGEPFLVIAEGLGDSVKLSVFGNSESLTEEALKKAIHVLALDEDLTKFYRIAAKDKLLWPLAGPLHGMHMRALPSLWEGVLVGVCQQNASFRQGWRMVYNLRKLLGEKIVWQGREFYTFPPPERVAREDEKLRAARVGYRKVTLVEVAKLFLQGEEDIESVKGIGRYTARIARILGLRDYSKMPVDRWFRRLIPFAYAGSDELWSEEQVEKFAEKMWGKWAGLAAVMLTVVTAAKPISQLLEDLKKGVLTPISTRPSPLTMWRYGL